VPERCKRWSDCPVRGGAVRNIRDRRFFDSARRVHRVHCGVAHSYEDLERLQTCFEGWDVELIQLGPRRQTGWASRVALPSRRIVRVHAGRSIVVRGTTSALDGCLLLCLQEAAVRWLGQPISGSRFALAGRRVRVDLFLPYDATLCVITTEAPACSAARRLQLLTTTPECITTLLGCVQSATEDHDQPPRAIDDALVAQVRKALQTSAPTAATSMRTQRAAAVARACRFIDSYLVKPIGLAELCAHCGVGVRTLEYGFKQFYDATPIGFIKSQRLTRTHTALARAGAQPISIGATARRVGFTHMGQFAQDYRSLFGESPTMTLRRAQERNEQLAGSSGRTESRRRPSAT
jgi:methylphosphotriester-DNA--protein-cysteine methyltransferase